MVPNHCRGCHRTMYHFSLTYRAGRPIGSPECSDRTPVLWIRVCRADILSRALTFLIRKEEKWIKGKWVDAQGFLEASTSKNPLHIVLL